MNDDVIEALESAAPGSGGSSFKTPMASKNDVRIFARTLLNFLDELPDDMSVGEVRRALEDY
jgi:hypothetical protein